MYTNKLFDELKQGDEIVVRYARGSKYAKGKVTKTTKTQLTVDLVREDGGSEINVRFNKSNGDEVGGKRYIAKDYAQWDENGKHLPERLMTYADADKLIEERKAEEAVKAAKRDEQQQAAEAKFASVIEKTRNDRQSLTLIDEVTGTYKIVVNTERDVRMLGIFTVVAKDYYDFDKHAQVSGFEVGLTYSNGQGSWPSCGTMNAATFEDAVDQVVYRMYDAW